MQEVFAFSRSSLTARRPRSLAKGEHFSLCKPRAPCSLQAHTEGIIARCWRLQPTGEQLLQDKSVKIDSASQSNATCTSVMWGGRKERTDISLFMFEIAKNNKDFHLVQAGIGAVSPSADADLLLLLLNPFCLHTPCCSLKVPAPFCPQKQQLILQRKDGLNNPHALEQTAVCSAPQRYFSSVCLIFLQTFSKLKI